MKKFFYLIAAIAMVSLVAACSNKAKSVEETEAAPAIVTYTVAQIADQSDSLIGQTIEVDGVCAHLCKHSLKKMFLVDPADSTAYLLCLATDSIGYFDKETLDKPVKVTGTLVAFQTECDSCSHADNHADTCQTSQKAKTQVYLQALNYQVAE